MEVQEKIVSSSVVLVAVPVANRITARGRGWHDAGIGVALCYYSFVRDDLRRKRPSYDVLDVRGALRHFEVCRNHINESENSEYSMNTYLMHTIAQRCVRKARIHKQLFECPKHNRKSSIGSVALDTLLTQALKVGIHEVVTPLTGSSGYEQEPIRVSAEQMGHSTKFIKTTLENAYQDIVDNSILPDREAVINALSHSELIYRDLLTGRDLGFFQMPESEDWIQNVDFYSIPTPELRSYRYNNETGRWNIYRLSTDDVAEYTIGVGLTESHSGVTHLL